MLKFFLLLGTLAALAAIAWMVLLPRVVERELRQLTGFDVKVKVLTVNPFTGRVVVRGLSVRNPPVYPAPDFVELIELKTDVNLFSWTFEDHVTIDNLEFDLGKVELIRLHNGQSNFGECQARLTGTAPASPAPKPVRYLVRRLHVRLEQLVVADYTGSKAQVKTYNLNIDQTYTNISDPRQLLVPQVVKTVYSFGLQHNVAQLLPGDFGIALGNAVSGVTVVGSKAKDLFKGLFDKLDHSSKP